MSTRRSALIVVDVQNDFVEGGALGVEGGKQVAQDIARHIATERDRYNLVVFTRDCHINPGDHFSDTPNYQTTWPPHCVADTPGVEFCTPLNTLTPDYVISKGAFTDAYSGFDGSTDGGLPLIMVLLRAGITDLVVCGIATDHCVKATALDGAAFGFGVAVDLDLSAGVAVDTVSAALDELRAANVDLRST